MKLKDKNCY